MKVLFVGQWFRPEPVQMPGADLRALEAHGHEVVVLTGKPNYPDGVLQDGWDQKRSDRVEEGRRVVRTAEYPSHSQSVAGRVANYLSWALSSIPDAVRRAREADVTFVYGSPITAALPAVIAKAVTGTPVVVQVQDMWPESLLTFRSDSRAFRLIEKPAYAVCDFLYRRADRLIAISPGAVDRLAGRGVDRDRITLVYNPATDEGEAVPPHEGDGPVKLLYGGNMGPNQRLDVLVDAIAGKEGAELTLMGKGTERADLERRVRELGAGNIAFRDPVYGPGYREAVAEHDVMVVSLRDEDVFRYTMPSKTQAILSFGRPILGICAGDLADVVRDSGAGWVAEPEDVRSVSSVIDAIVARGRAELADAGRRGREFYDRTMGTVTFAERLDSVVNVATAGTAGRGLRRK